MNPEVSVVIPAHRAEGTIDACLESVFANRGVSFEVLVVEDASPDATLDRALAYPCRVISLRRNIQAANCRNLGASMASADVLVFFDADQTMPPGTLRAFLSELEGGDASAVVASFQAHTPAPGYFSKFKNLRHHHVHQTARREGATLASGLTAIRRSAFEECGGFEPAYAAASIEDIALGYELRRRGHRILFSPAIQVTHLKTYSLGSLLRSDLFDRAIPWTALMLRERIWRSDLNTDRGNVLSVALAFCLPLACFAPGVVAPLLLAAGLVLALGVLNSALLRAAHRYFGPSFLLRTLVFIPVMYFVHGVGLLLGVTAYCTGRSAARKRARPVPEYRVLDGDLPVAARVAVSSSGARRRGRGRWPSTRASRSR